ERSVHLHARRVRGRVPLALRRDRRRGPGRPGGPTRPGELRAWPARVVRSAASPPGTRLTLADGRGRCPILRFSIVPYGSSTVRRAQAMLFTGASTPQGGGRR